jgi:DNA-binding PadR family transcriptional regulator
LNESLHPYVVFLPSDEKTRILNAIFGSKAAVDILRFSLNQGLSSRIYQKDLVSRLSYSNKTVIENLKTMTKLGILKEEMEKNTKTGRIVWVKVYQLSDAGRWFALLLAEEKDLSTKETAEILQNLFRAYIRWVKNLSKKLQISNKELEKIFVDEMKADD